jgi:RNA recognition motif-containing protein
MSKNLYVGNLSYTVSNSELEQLFASHGTVESAYVVVEHDTGRSKGFGFVEMSTDKEAQAAIAALDGQQISGRRVRVSEARPRQKKGRVAAVLLADEGTVTLGKSFQISYD